GQRLTFGAAHRASEQAVAWFAGDGATSESSSVRGGDEFYMALMWSGAWTATFDRTAAGLQLAIGLPAMTTTVEQATDGPHLVFGAAGGGMPGASSAPRSLIFDGIRARSPITPPVAHNT